MNNIEKSLETIGKTACVVCYILTLIWAYMAVVEFGYLPIIILGGLIMFGSYFLMFDKGFYDHMTQKSVNFRISRKKHLLILTIFIIPIFYILTSQCLSLIIKLKDL